MYRIKIGHYTIGWTWAEVDVEYCRQPYIYVQDDRREDVVDVVQITIPWFEIRFASGSIWIEPK